jgi:PAS domain S-box-containing protein
MTTALFSNSNEIDKIDRSDHLYPAISVTETVINGFITVDHDWIVMSWNNAAEKLLGVQAKNIVGKNLWKEFAGIIPLNFYTGYHKSMLQDIPVHFREYWVEMGTWFDVITYYSDDRLSLSFRSSNQLQAIQPQLKLKILNELYRFVTEVTNDCLWEWNIPDHEIFWIDGGHKRVFGYNIENALISQNFWESHLHPDDKQRVLAGVLEAFMPGVEHVWEAEYQFKKANGSYASVHDRGHVIYEHGKAIRMIGATLDITARKLMESKLNESERKLSLIARQTVNAVIITDSSEKIVWVNEAFTRITEYEPEEVMGRKPGSFLQGKDTNPFTVAYLRQKMKALQPFDCEIINYSKSGRKYWIHMQGQALFDNKGTFDRYFAIQTDVTEKKLLESKLQHEKITKQREITDAVIMAQEQERLDIAKELHDNVNQILGATKLYIEMAKAEVEKRDIFLDEACVHLLNCIEEIRRISKRLVPQSLDIIGLRNSIKTLINDLSGIHPIKIKFTEAGIEHGHLNEKLQLNIFRIVQEQVNNILKHSSAKRASISLIKNKNNVRLLISDNGKGCETTTKKEGIGIRNIISRTEQFHGNLVIVSKPDKGYKLKITFPLIIAA